MNLFVTMTGIWAVHAALGAALSAPILFFARKRIVWASWELLALVLPFCVWLLLMISPLSDGRKTLANLGEPIYISFAMPLAVLLRVAVGKQCGGATCAIGIVAVLCIIAAATFFLVPIKPE